MRHFTALHTTFFLGAVLLLALCLNRASAQEGRPIPPGIRQADKVVVEGEKNIPPALEQRKGIDFDQMQRDANELAKMAQAVPTQVNQAANGVLAKDLGVKLKKIEKLSKKLRNQLTQ